MHPSQAKRITELDATLKVGITGLEDATLLTPEGIELACAAYFEAATNELRGLGRGVPADWTDATMKYGRVWADERREWMKAALRAVGFRE